MDINAIAGNLDAARANRKVAFIFPGQGAQYPSMGSELYESSSAAREVFNIADSIRPGTSNQCFHGSEDELRITANTQPCLFCVDLAAAAALHEAGITPAMLAGFSLGELAALTFAGALSYESGFRLVCKRADYMHSSAKQADAGMSAVLKLSDEAVINICSDFDNIFPVNFNCPGQVVVAGNKHELELLKAKVKEAGGRAVPLKTSGAFHSPYMAGASEAFAKALDEFDMLAPQIPVYSNVTALSYDGDYKELLAKQISSPVLWSSVIRQMIAAGAEVFVEVGPSKTLCGLVERISDSVRVLNVEDRNSLQSAIKELTD